jgi:hypothetical protein
MTKYRGLEVSYNALWEKAPKPILKQLLTPISPEVKDAQNVIKLMYKLVLVIWLS